MSSLKHPHGPTTLIHCEILSIQMFNISKCLTLLADEDFIHSLVTFGVESGTKFWTGIKFNFA